MAQPRNERPPWRELGGRLLGAARHSDDPVSDTLTVMRLWFGTLVLLAATSAWAEVTVLTESDRVSLRAVAAPLNAVLDQLARKTGMKVVYEGGPPRQPVTLTVEGRTATEAVLAVLEGQGVNFGLRADESGKHVVSLIVAGQAPAGAVTTGAAAAPQKPGPVSAPVPVPEEEYEKEEPPDEEVLPPGAPQPQPPPQAQPGPLVPQAPTYFKSPFAPQAQPLLAPPGQPATPPPPDEKQP